jgi:AraC-like DNA-binding protein
MAESLKDKSADRAVFRRSQLFGGIELMTARFVDHAFAPHTHNELMIGAIFAGVKAFRLERQIHLAGPGALSIVNPGEMHTGERRHGSQLIYAALYVPRVALEHMLHTANAVGRSLCQPVIEDDELSRGIVAAHSALFTGKDDIEAEELLVLSLQSLYSRYGSTAVQTERSSCPRSLATALAFLADNASSRVTLEDAARVAGIGPFHLIRLCRRHVGLTPHAYVTQVRVERAKRLLKSGTPAAHVALDVGFADQAHFSKRFKQLTGTTPAHYAAA